ncbi:vitamin D-binding protein [Dromiciops gliroides]|uniref:vitamin D-binding protein n=1 Tax=Dromiciops gliroides TaxID=33562 RepID=UPI001CC67466|nr:vitamin D-binding protein [Dromiciops gliroides]
MTFHRGGEPCGVNMKSRSLKMLKVLVLLLSVTFIHAEHRGRDYEKSKVCKEFTNLGKDDFQSLSFVLYSRKFPSGTFEQVKALIDEVVSLTETCCDVNADPGCYDTKTSELSVKSCENDSPFPKHPETDKCCAQEGLERKLCMAALNHPPQEFPTYVEPSNDEICDSFRRDPRGFANKFLYEYSRNYGQAPLPLLVSYTRNYLSMVGTCCTSNNPTPCFLSERLQSKHLSLLTTMSNRVCSQFAILGTKKTRFSYIVKFAQKVPTANLEDVVQLAEDMTSVLSKCCDSILEDCMANALAEHTVKVCEKLSTKDKRLGYCCAESSPMDIFLCIYSTPASPPLKLPEIFNPTNDEICNTENNEVLDKYTYEISRRKPNIPEVFITKLHGLMQEVLLECCKAAEPEACLRSQRPLARKEMALFLTKAEELCGDYSQHTFTEYKKRLTENFKIKFPKANSQSIKEMVENRADFASKCCLMNSPPLYCGTQIDAETKNFCGNDSCLLSLRPT